MWFQYKTGMEYNGMQAPKSFCPKDVKECLKKLLKPAKRIFLDAQKDFFELKTDLYFCNPKTAQL
jgi:hypothetical protein